MVTISPEAITLAGAALWILAAFVTGLPRGRVPSEFPFLFSIIGIIGSALAVTEWTPAPVDIWLTFGAIALYALMPIVFTAWLLHRYDDEEGHSDDNPRTVT